MLDKFNILFPTTIFFLLCLVIPKITSRFGLLKNSLNKNHNVNNQKASISGGICLVIALLSFYLINKNFFYFEYAILIFFIGLLSDTKIIESPKKRLFLIIITLFLFSFIKDFSILETNVIYIDQFIKNSGFFKIIFFVFCISILINGCNFIDGINNNLNFYLLCSNLSILLLKLKLGINFDLNIILILISLIFLFFNFFDKIFFGDSGAYFIGFILGVDLVHLFNLNTEISKFFAVLIFFYPCFEVLFSMIRKNSLKYSPLHADKNHLHTILAIFLIKQKKEKKNAHFLASCFLNIIFFIPILFNMNKYYHTKNISITIFILIMVYLILFNTIKTKIK